ncbi:hypothetical protein AAVH_27541 [Aphelenchoides avenae]|nr:hypothetical protein AAVH_27541 [Aphelenchus avenae]
MLKVTPNVSNVDKLRVTIKVNSTSLEDAVIDSLSMADIVELTAAGLSKDVVIASLSKADIDKLIAAGFKDLGEDRWQKIESKCRSMNL